MREAMPKVSRVAVTMLALAVSAGAYATGEGEFEKTVPAEARGAVDISNVSGTVVVMGWDRPEVSVRAQLAPGVERVDVTSDHGHTLVRVVLPHAGHGGETELQVKVPKESEVDVSAVSADVTSSGVLGVQRLHTVSGEIVAEIAGSDIDAKSVSGDIKLKGHGQPARLRVNSVSGDVRLDHGAGDLEAGSVSGTLVVSLDSARSVRARSTSGDLHFEGKLTRGADLDASTVSGNLNVRASAEGGFNYEVSSFSGDITNCFGAEVIGHHHGPGHRLEGSRGDGAGRVYLKSMSGDIELCDRK